MEINWTILAIVTLCVIILIVYVVKQNRKDKKNLTKFLNNDFKKKEESEFEED